jgi:hypothetical protein
MLANDISKFLLFFCHGSSLVLLGHCYDCFTH